MSTKQRVVKRPELPMKQHGSAVRTGQSSRLNEWRSGRRPPEYPPRYKRVWDDHHSERRGDGARWDGDPSLCTQKRTPNSSRSLKSEASNAPSQKYCTSKGLEHRVHSTAEFASELEDREMFLLRRATAVATDLPTERTIGTTREYTKIHRRQSSVCSPQECTEKPTPQTSSPPLQTNHSVQQLDQRLYSESRNPHAITQRNDPISREVKSKTLEKEGKYRARPECESSLLHFVEGESFGTKTRTHRKGSSTSSPTGNHDSNPMESWSRETRRARECAVKQANSIGFVKTHVAVERNTMNVQTAEFGVQAWSQMHTRQDNNILRASKELARSAPAGLRTKHVQNEKSRRALERADLRRENTFTQECAKNCIRIQMNLIQVAEASPVCTLQNAGPSAGNSEPEGFHSIWNNDAPIAHKDSLEPDAVPQPSARIGNMAKQVGVMKPVTVNRPEKTPISKEPSTMLDSAHRTRDGDADVLDAKHTASGPTARLTVIENPEVRRWNAVDSIESTKMKSGAARHILNEIHGGVEDEKHCRSGSTRRNCTDIDLETSESIRCLRAGTMNDTQKCCLEEDSFKSFGLEGHKAENKSAIDSEVVAKAGTKVNISVPRGPSNIEAAEDGEKCFLWNMPEDCNDSQVARAHRNRNEHEVSVESHRGASAVQDEQYTNNVDVLHSQTKEDDTDIDLAIGVEYRALSERLAELYPTPLELVIRKERQQFGNLPGMWPEFRSRWASEDSKHLSQTGGFVGTQNSEGGRVGLIGSTVANISTAMESMKEVHANAGNAHRKALTTSSTWKMDMDCPNAAHRESLHRADSAPDRNLKCWEHGVEREGREDAVQFIGLNIAAHCVQHNLRWKEHGTQVDCEMQEDSVQSDEPNMAARCAHDALAECRRSKASFVVQDTELGVSMAENILYASGIHMQLESEEESSDIDFAIDHEYCMLSEGVARLNQATLELAEESACPVQKEFQSARLELNADSSEMDALNRWREGLVGVAENILRFQEHLEHHMLNDLLVVDLPSRADSIESAKLAIDAMVSCNRHDFRAMEKRWEHCAVSHGFPHDSNASGVSRSPRNTKEVHENICRNTANLRRDPDVHALEVRNSEEYNEDSSRNRSRWEEVLPVSWQTPRSKGTVLDAGRHPLYAESIKNGNHHHEDGIAVERDLQTWSQQVQQISHLLDDSPKHYRSDKSCSESSTSVTGCPVECTRAAHKLRMCEQSISALNSKNSEPAKRDQNVGIIAAAKSKDIPKGSQDKSRPTGHDGGVVGTKPLGISAKGFRIVQCKYAQGISLIEAYSWNGMRTLEVLRNGLCTPRKSPMRRRLRTASKQSKMVLDSFQSKIKMEEGGAPTVFDIPEHGYSTSTEQKQSETLALPEEARSQLIDCDGKKKRNSTRTFEYLENTEDTEGFCIRVDGTMNGNTFEAFLRTAPNALSLAKLSGVTGGARFCIEKVAGMNQSTIKKGGTDQHKVESSISRIQGLQQQILEQNAKASKLHVTGCYGKWSKGTAEKAAQIILYRMLTAGSRPETKRVSSAARYLNAHSCEGREGGDVNDGISHKSDPRTCQVWSTIEVRRLQDCAVGGRRIPSIKDGGSRGVPAHICISTSIGISELEMSNYFGYLIERGNSSVYGKEIARVTPKKLHGYRTQELAWKLSRMVKSCTLEWRMAAVCRFQLKSRTMLQCSTQCGEQAKMTPRHGVKEDESLPDSTKLLGIANGSPDLQLKIYSTTVATLRGHFTTQTTHNACSSAGNAIFPILRWESVRGLNQDPCISTII
ncbi:hypothetical protein K438DRAFT_1774967 [Mycena galopus ATCC 62051]|nr:hypothetical protein K438DRAFT_1774967 [Mycena galopus ATCC 62051]